MVFTMYYQMSEEDQSDELSMAEVVELCENGGITDATLVYTDDIEMDGWMPFGDVKDSLDWEDEDGEQEGEWEVEGEAFTSLYYQITEDEQSDECDMHEVIQLINDGVITDETLVWAEGLDGWVLFEEAKYYCEWPDDGEEESGGETPETVYYESAPDENEEVTFDEFKLLVEGGLVDDDTNIWAEGLSGWMPLGEAKAAIGLGEVDAGEELEETEETEEGEPDEEAAAAAAAEAELEQAMAADEEQDESVADAEAQLEAALAGADEPAPVTGKSKKKRTTTISEANPPPSARKGKIKVGGKNSGNTRMRNHSSLVKETIDEQAEFFLRKFNRHADVDRPSVMKLKKEFEKFDTFGKRELDDMQAMRMLEARGQPHSLLEIRQVVVDMKHDSLTKNLTFLEWACAVFKKSWEELHTEVEIEVSVVETEEEKAARKAAELEAAKAAEQAEQSRLAALRGADADKAKAEALAEAAKKEEALAEEATAAKAQADAEKAKVQEKIAADEAEKQKKRDAMTAAKSGSGAKSRMAAFNMMAEGEGGMSVEEQVRLEAAQRKEARAAKKRLAEEQEAAQRKLEEDKAAAEAAAAKAAEEKAAAEKAAAEAEEARLKAEAEAEEQARLSELKAIEEAEAEKKRIEEEEKRLYEEAKRKEAEEEAAKKAEEKRIREEKRKKMAERAAMFNQ